MPFPFADPLRCPLENAGLPGGAQTQFEPCRDVSYGGVLCAIPALAQNGLFRHLQTTFPTLTGYYSTLHVILLLAYMALCRIRTVEQLQYESPGELGKLMGLDRVPEVRCLRNKLKFPKEDWPVSEFSEVTATMPTGEQVAVKLAERGSLVGTDRVWMRSAS